jgi:hypothetical protein
VQPARAVDADADADLPAAEELAPFSSISMPLVWNECCTLTAPGPPLTPFGRSRSIVAKASR